MNLELIDGDTSSVVNLGVIECFGHYHYTLSPKDGPPEVDHASECVPYKNKANWVVVSIQRPFEILGH